MTNDYGLISTSIVVSKSIYESWLIKTKSYHIETQIFVFGIHNFANNLYTKKWLYSSFNKVVVKLTLNPLKNIASKYPHSITNNITCRLRNTILLYKYFFT